MQCLDGSRATGDTRLTPAPSVRGGKRSSAGRGRGDVTRRGSGTDRARDGAQAPAPSGSKPAQTQAERRGEAKLREAPAAARPRARGQRRSGLRPRGGASRIPGHRQERVGSPALCEGRARGAALLSGPFVSKPLGAGLRPATQREGSRTAQAREPPRLLGLVVLPPNEILKELDDYYEKFKRETDGAQKRRLLHCIQRALIRSQELGDEKIQIVSQMVELVENRTRQVDSHVELFEAHQEVNDTTGHGGKAGQDKSKNETITQAEKPNNKRSRRQRNNENRENAANIHDHDDITSVTPKEKKAKASKKKKRSKAKAEREASPADLPIDPNEPTYCLCNQVSYGEMIGCDNDECPIEWFHFSCVGLNHKPKGKWYCPKCRGENEKTMDKALEKSKKERAYNR
ncbi:PREDICTED: inhibitor of growth protein 1 [Ceratotherium simum simum]|uniref:Inhibitor of growth protein n=1 Tax=Ceratotherium simum simum TaxID=73337 RepID=A0ABM1CCI7_CERSS|nr:PREDICTED: inhibitor of growth protein 1 [Ceratotherium simum simum]